MTKEQIDSHITRLLAGEFVVDNPDGGYLFIRNPAPRIKLAGDRILNENDQGYTQEELNKFLNDTRTWNSMQDHDIAKLQDSLQDLKLELWYEDVSLREPIRDKIASTLKLLSEMLSKKHSYDYLLKRYVGASAKYKYIISKSIIDENGNLVDPDEHYLNIDLLVAEHMKARCNDEEIREIALSDNWKLLWDAAKHNHQGLFRGCMADLSDEQISLISWSKFFDDVKEHPEFPGDEVLHDSDLFDGWCLHQKKKHSGEIDKRDISGRIPNHIKECGEIFVVRQHELNSDDPAYFDNDKQSFVRKVESFNDSVAKGAKSIRSKAIKENGIIFDSDLPDNKRDIQMAFARGEGQA